MLFFFFASEVSISLPALWSFAFNRLLQIYCVRKYYSVVEAFPEIDHPILTCERVCHDHFRSLSGNRPRTTYGSTVYVLTIRIFIAGNLVWRAQQEIAWECVH
jgi:hypothetical protein